MALAITTQIAILLFVQLRVAYMAKVVFSLQHYTCFRTMRKMVKF